MLFLDTCYVKVDAAFFIPNHGFTYFLVGTKAYGSNEEKTFQKNVIAEKFWPGLPSTFDEAFVWPGATYRNYFFKVCKTRSFIIYSRSFIVLFFDKEVSIFWNISFLRRV